MCLNSQLLQLNQILAHGLVVIAIFATVGKLYIFRSSVWNVAPQSQLLGITKTTLKL